MISVPVYLFGSFSALCIFGNKVETGEMHLHSGAAGRWHPDLTSSLQLESRSQNPPPPVPICIQLPLSPAQLGLWLAMTGNQPAVSLAGAATHTV